MGYSLLFFHFLLFVFARCTCVMQWYAPVFNIFLGMIILKKLTSIANLSIINNSFFFAFSIIFDYRFFRTENYIIDTIIIFWHMSTDTPVQFCLHFIFFFFTSFNFLWKRRKLSSADCFVIITGTFIFAHCFQWCVEIFIFVLFSFSPIKRSMYVTRDWKIDYWRGIERNRSNSLDFRFSSCMRTNGELLNTQHENKNAKKKILLFQISISLHFHIVRVKATPVNWNLSLILWKEINSFHIFFFVHVHRLWLYNAMIYCKWNGSEKKKIQTRMGKLASFLSAGCYTPVSIVILR